MAELTTAKRVIEETLELKAKRILDIGCGTGKLVRLFARRGGEAIGVDPQSEQIARAEAAGSQEGARFMVSGGESLPFDDASFDIVTIFNALHHIPQALMRPALAEAARVLKPGGVLWIWEPVAAGSAHELCVPIDDETIVRAQAYDALKEGIPGLSEEREITVDTPYKVESFDGLKAELLAVDPARAETMARNEAELRKRWERLGEEMAEGGKLFIQPARLNLFRKAA